jgi:hypothetical protein
MRWGCRAAMGPRGYWTAFVAAQPMAPADCNHSLGRRAHGDCNTMRACNAVTSLTTFPPT